MIRAAITSAGIIEYRVRIPYVAIYSRDRYCERRLKTEQQEQCQAQPEHRAAAPFGNSIREHKHLSQFARVRESLEWNHLRATHAWTVPNPFLHPFPPVARPLMARWRLSEKKSDEQIPIRSQASRTKRYWDTESTHQSMGVRLWCGLSRFLTLLERLRSHQGNPRRKGRIWRHDSAIGLQGAQARCGSAFQLTETSTPSERRLVVVSAAASVGRLFSGAFLTTILGGC